MCPAGHRFIQNPLDSVTKRNSYVIHSWKKTVKRIRRLEGAKDSDFLSQQLTYLLRRSVGHDRCFSTLCQSLKVSF